MNKNNDLFEQPVSSESVYDGKLLHVRRDTVTLPNGKNATRELIRHVGAVCIVPVTDDGQICLERQFRYPLGRVIVEVPAGKLDSREENPLSAARRELQEETGLSADEWIDLGAYYPTPAYSDEVIRLYLARSLHTGEQKLDDDEFLRVYTAPITDVVDEIMAGRIADGKTVAAVLKAARYLGI